MIAAALIACLTFGGAAVGAAAPASAPTIVENLVVRLGGATVTIRRAEVAAGGSSSGEIVGVFDPANPTPLVARLRGLQSPAIVMPDLRVEIPFGAATLELVGHDVHVADVVNGRIGAVSIGGIDVSAGRGPQPAHLGHTGEATARNFDLVLLARLFTEARPAAGEALAPLFDAVAIDAIEFADASRPSGAKMSMHRLRASGMALRALNVPIVGIEAHVRSSATRAEWEQSQAALIDDWFDSFAIGHLEASRLHLELPDRAPVTVSIDRLALDDPADTRRGAWTIEGASLAAGGASASLGEASIQGIDTRPRSGPSAMAALGLVRLGDANPAEMLRAMVPRFDRAWVAGLIVHMTEDGAREGPAVTVLRLDRAAVALADFVNGLPAALTFDVHGLVLDLAKLDLRGSMPLREMGYDTLELREGRLDVAWNAALRRVRVKQFELAAAGMGRLEGSATIDNADAGLFSRDPVVEAAAALSLVFKAANVEVVNDGLAEKWFAMLARDRQPVGELKQELTARLGVLVQRGLVDTAKTAAVLGALTQFIDTPRNLRVNVTAAAGLSIPDTAAARTPADVFQKLDVTAAANR